MSREMVACVASKPRLCRRRRSRSWLCSASRSISSRMRPWRRVFMESCGRGSVRIHESLHESQRIFIDFHCSNCARLCISYSFPCILHLRSSAARRDRRRRPTGARRRRRRHRLHRPGAAAAAGAPSGGAADAGDVVGRGVGGAAAAGAGAGVERRDRRRSIRDALAREADLVFLALPDTAAAELAPALLDAGVRVIDLSGAFRLRDAALRARWYPETQRAAGRASPTASPSASAAGGARARSWSPIPAAIRPRRCSRWRRWSAPACSSPAPTSSSTPSRACRAPARRRPSGRIFPRCTAACRPTASSTTSTAPRSSRGSAARSPSRRTWCRSTAASWRRSTCASRRARPTTRCATVYERGLRDATFVRLVGADAAGDQARRAHQFLRHRLAGRSVGPGDSRVGHRQPAQGRVGPGGAEHERDAGPRRSDGAAVMRATVTPSRRRGLLTCRPRRWSSSSAASCSRIATRLQAVVGGDGARRRRRRAAGHRARRRQGDRRRAEGRRHREAAGRRPAHHRRADARRRGRGAGRRGEHAAGGGARRPPASRRSA